MSAAAVRRRKQLAAHKAANNQEDNVSAKLTELLSRESLDEATAYEALQLAQSTIRKKVQAVDTAAEGCDLCFQSGLNLLKKGRVSVASQLMALLTDTLRETGTLETDEWIDRLLELHSAHQDAMTKTSEDMSPTEITRLQRLERDWLLRALQWSADAGTIKLGHQRLQKVLGEHCWELANMEKGVYEADEVADLQCDAVQHMVLAEEPAAILAWLVTLEDPTDEETKMGHSCPPALRDALLTRAILGFGVMQNLRDGHTLIRGYIEKCEKRSIDELKKSYTNKEDGKAPSHVLFGSMLLSILAKDARTGPLFSWLMRSFKRELDGMAKNQVVHGWATKIGALYFNIQPPPNMLNMMENMMGMMGGGGGGINPAMMQAMAAQMQGGM